MRRKRMLEKMFGHDLADALENFGDLFKVGTADEIIDSLINENNRTPTQSLVKGSKKCVN